MKLARRLNQSSENGFSTSDFKDILGEIEMKVGCCIYQTSYMVVINLLTTINQVLVMCSIYLYS